MEARVRLKACPIWSRNISSQRPTDLLLFIRMSFRDSSIKLPTAIGYDGLLYHDLRPTAIRNMRRRGVQEGAAMLISGHETRDVFERYNIVDGTDLREARDRMQQGEEAEMDRLREYEAGLESRPKVKAQLHQEWA